MEVAKFSTIYSTVLVRVVFCMRIIHVRIVLARTSIYIELVCAVILCVLDGLTKKVNPVERWALTVHTVRLLFIVYCFVVKATDNYESDSPISSNRTLSVDFSVDFDFLLYKDIFMMEGVDALEPTEVKRILQYYGLTPKRSGSLNQVKELIITNTAICPEAGASGDFMSATVPDWVKVCRKEKLSEKAILSLHELGVKSMECISNLSLRDMESAAIKPADQTKICKMVRDTLDIESSETDDETVPSSQEVKEEKREIKPPKVLEIEEKSLPPVNIPSYREKEDLGRKRYGKQKRQILFLHETHDHMQRPLYEMF